MAFARPFAYNPGSEISGTTQLGNLSIGTPITGFTSSPQFWNGPDEDAGYIIAIPVSGNTQPTEISGVTASIGFYGTSGFSDVEFIQLAEIVSNEFGNPQTFANASDASTWLTANGFFNSFVPTPGITSTPTLTPTGTPLGTTPTPTLTQTPTPTDLSSVTTYTISACTSLNVLVADLGPGAFAPGDVFYLDFTGSTATECYTIINKINATPTDGSSPISYYPNCADCIDGTTTTYTISGCTNLNVLVADLGPGAFAPGDIFNMTFTGATPNGCYRIVNKIVASPTDSGSPLTFYLNCDACEASLVTPTPTPTLTPTGTSLGTTPTPTLTPTGTSLGTTPTPTLTPTSGVAGNFNVTISQQGPDVVWNGSGSFNLGALTLGGTQNLGAGMAVTQGIWAIGPTTTVQQYNGTFTTFPSNIGPGGTYTPPSSSGSTFGILTSGGGRMLIVPTGYTSNTVISGIAIYTGTTIAAMGLSGGTYTWAWGSGGNASTLVMTIEEGSVTPTPTLTPTQTPTPTLTPTGTPASTPTGTPIAETPTLTPTQTPTGGPINQLTVYRTYTENPSGYVLGYFRVESQNVLDSNIQINFIETLPYNVGGTISLSGSAILIGGDITGATYQLFSDYYYSGLTQAPGDDISTIGIIYTGSSGYNFQVVYPAVQYQNPSPTPTPTLTPTGTSIPESPTPTPTETPTNTPTPSLTGYTLDYDISICTVLGVSGTGGIEVNGSPVVSSSSTTSGQITFAVGSTIQVNISGFKTGDNVGTSASIDEGLTNLFNGSDCSADSGSVFSTVVTPTGNVTVSLNACTC